MKVVVKTRIFENMLERINFRRTKRRNNLHEQFPHAKQTAKEKSETTCIKIKVEKSFCEWKGARFKLKFRSALWKQLTSNLVRPNGHLCCINELRVEWIKLGPLAGHQRAVPPLSQMSVWNGLLLHSKSVSVSICRASRRPPRIMPFDIRKLTLCRLFYSWLSEKAFECHFQCFGTCRVHSLITFRWIQIIIQPTNQPTN